MMPNIWSDKAPFHILGFLFMAFTNHAYKGCTEIIETTLSKLRILVKIGVDIEETATNNLTM